MHEDKSGQPSTIAVLGGTGRSGKYVVQELIREGLHVKMLVRSPEKAPPKHPQIEVVLGSARNSATIQRLLNNCTAVISTLGPSKGETDICSMAARNITWVMRQINITRYIEVAGLGLILPGDKRRLLSRMIAWAIHTFSPSTVNDRQRGYEILAASQTDWTIVRCPNIEVTDTHRKIVTSLKDNPGFKVTAADLARFIAGQIYSVEFIRKGPFIASI